MSEEKIIVKLELDESSVTKSVDDTGKKIKTTVDTSFNSQATIAFGESLKLLNSKLEEITHKLGAINDQSRSVAANSGVLFNTISGLAKVASLSVIGFVAAFGLFRGLGQDIKSITEFYQVSGRGLFHLVDVLGATTVKLGFLASDLSLIDNEFAQIASSTLGYASILSGLFTIALVVAIDKVSELAYELGTKLSEAFRKSYNEFINFRKETIQFNEIIKAYSKETMGASGSTESWNEKILELNKTLNFSIGDLRKSTSELVAVGTRLGLTEEQVSKLLVVVSEYATITGKDLFQTTVAFATALQGNAQAVQSYGVKLTEASNASFAFKNGMAKSFTQMTELEKEQVRYNNLLSQYGTIAGIAGTVANDWFNQTKKLEATQARLNTQVGLGAAYVEDLNLVAASLNTILGSVGDGTARLFGFLGAASGRLLQIVGLFVEWSFKIFLVYRSMQLLDLLLKSNTWINFVNQVFPVLGKSLVDVASGAAKAQVNLVGVKNILSSLGSVFQAQKNNIVGWIFGVQAAGTGLGSIIGLIGTRVAGAFSAIAAGFSTLLVPLLPIIGIITGITAVFFGLFKVFEKINEKTQFFTEIWALITRGFDQFLALFTGVGGIFDSILQGLQTVIGTFFGIFVGFFSQIFKVIAVIIEKNPMGIFSEQTVKAFARVNASIDTLQKNLQLAKGNIFALGETMQASAKQANKAKFDYEAFAEVVKNLNEISGGDVGKIQRQLADRLKVINGAKMAEVTSAQEIERLKGIAILDAQKQVNQLLESEIGFNGQSVLEKEKGIYDRRKALLDNLLNANLLNEITYNERSKQIMDDYNNKIKASNDKKISLAQQYMDKFTYLTEEQAETAAKIAQAVSNSTNDLVSGTFQRMGESLINGQSAWGDFAGFIYGVLGDLLIKVGIAVIGIGEAVTAVIAALSFNNPFAAFAAGAALIVAGGALKALAKNSGGTAAAAGSITGSGGAASVGNSTNPEVAPRADAERQAPDRSVVINIEGSLFSTEATSKSLIAMISKEFDKTGADIRRRSFA